MRAALALALALVWIAGAQDLPRLWIEGPITVSGVSSGADMASQLMLIASDLITGVGIFAGQPYMCAVQRFPGEPLMTCAQEPASQQGPGCVGFNSTGSAPCIGCPAGSTLLYDHCKTPAEPQGPGWVDVATLVALAQQQAAAGRIAPLENLRAARMYLYRGSKDAVYLDGAVNKTRDLFAALVQNATEQIHFEASIPSGHCTPSVDPWLPPSTCGVSQPWAPPAIQNCGYDGAGVMFRHLYAPQTLVAPPAGATTNPANVMLFDQAPYWATTVDSGLASRGYLYVPRSCADLTQPCSLHVALHGCGMGAPFPRMNTSYVMHAGFNPWAELNRIVVLYPQGGGFQERNATAQAPSTQIAAGCFDGYGQTGPDFATVSGPQVIAIRAMIEAIAGPARPRQRSDLQ